MSNNKIGGIYSWPVIILALIFFWPLGLFLIIKRTTLDKTAVMKDSSLDKTAVMKDSSGKGLKITAIVLLVLGGFGIIGSFDPFDFGSLVIFLFFIAGGVILLNKAKKIKAEGESIKKYLAIIVNGGERQLDAVASATGKQYDVVKNDVQKMIDKGFLKNAYINENTREVVLASAASSNVNVAQPTGGAAPAAVQTRVIACPCCGANNTISGDIGECEYCGTPLK